MNSAVTRMCDGHKEPDDASVAKWIGTAGCKYWNQLRRFIDASYPGVFHPDWWFGGKRFGWSLRYKKSKSFCNLIPEKVQFKLLLVFGRDEREKVERELPRLTPRVRAAYQAATTFHDGKWLGLVADGPEILSDIELLLKIKRRPNQAPPSTSASRHKYEST